MKTKKQQSPEVVEKLNKLADEIIEHIVTNKPDLHWGTVDDKGKDALRRAFRAIFTLDGKRTRRSAVSWTGYKRNGNIDQEAFWHCVDHLGQSCWLLHLGRRGSGFGAVLGDNNKARCVGRELYAGHPDQRAKAGVWANDLDTLVQYLLLLLRGKTSAPGEAWSRAIKKGSI